jgi:ribonuclease VapC
MVVDTSGILAILQDEPERRAFNEAIETAPVVTISIANLVESSIVVEARFGPAGVLAIARAEPLLCKGDDFVHTDVEVARPNG